MKNFAVLIILFIAFQGAILSQSCLPEGITFETQAQIDSFQVSFPGCTVIKGDVVIWGSVYNLYGISVLDSIQGNLEIYYSYNLMDIRGLNNLKYIGGDFLSRYNGLYDYTGLDMLNTIGGDMQIEFCEYLDSLSGLENLTFIGGDLEISNNDNLICLSGLENLTFIGAELDIWANISLQSLTALGNVNASSISRLWIYDNGSLSECHAQSICQYLADPHGMVDIFNNGPGCENPHEIANSCGFELSCLPFGNYYFNSQVDIDSFPSYYPNCSTLEGLISIESSYNITNLDSLNVIDTINGTLSICGNYNLTSLNGLHNLREIQGSLYLGGNWCGGNPLLTDLDGLNNLTTIGESMILSSNSGLSNLSGLDSLTTIGDLLYILENNSLLNLDGMNGLTAVGSISMEFNPKIRNLDALLNLVHINGGFEIKYTHSLTTLSGIANIDADSLQYLRIQYNDSLTECNVRSVCDYLHIPEAIIEIYENAPGCNSRDEVETACEVGIGESAVGSQQSAVSIYPNPSSTQITIETPETTSKFLISIFNFNGQEIIRKQITGPLATVDVSHLPPGLYFVKITTDETFTVMKLVKE